MQSLFRVALALLLAMAQPGHAISPLTPRLASQTHSVLLAGLSATGFPEVGQNSVVIAITQALGLEPRNNTYAYKERYPHLPQVTATAVRLSDTCAKLEAVAWFEPPASPLRVSIKATYCLSGPAQWSATEQSVEKMADQ